MLKRVTILVVVISIIAFSIAAIGAINQQGELAKISDDEYIYTEGMLKHHLKVISNARGRAEVIDTLRWWGFSDDWQINGAHPYTFPGDTVVSDYKLIPDPAFLIEVRGIFGSGGGQADFYITDGRYDSEGQELNGFGPNTLANVTWNVVGSPGTTWEGLDFSPSPDTLFLPWSSDPDPANRPHWVVGYICSGITVAQGGGEPDIYYDFNSYWLRASLGGPNGHSWFSYNGATWYGIIYSGNNCWAQYMLDVVVNYYNGTSPFINSLSQLNNTWYTSNFSSITSEILDIDGSVAGAWLFYETQNSSIDSVTATTINGDMYSFDIPGTFTAGDTITYWLKAEDNEGKSILSAITRNFVVKAPQNPAAEVLVVHDQLLADEADLALFYEPLLNAVINDSLGKEYEIWNVQENYGIDNSVTDYSSFKTALIFGYGVSNVPPLDYSTSVWENFVEAGNNVMISSADWLYANNVTGEYTPVSGDFLKDVMGVGWVHSDPNNGADPAVSRGEEILIGVGGDPISTPWSGTPLFFDFGILLDGVTTTGNWNDYAEHDPTNPNAATVFLGVSFGRGNGVRNMNSFGGATLYLPFHFSAIADTTAQGEGYPLPDAYKLLKNYFDYASVTSIDEAGTGTPLSYDLRPNYPNPFNPSTTITYSIQKAGLVKLTVYNLLGERVRTLINITQAPDVYHISWDGKNDAGINVASGVYIYKLSAGDFSNSRKMILMK